MPRPRVFSFGGLFTPATTTPTSPILASTDQQNGAKRALNLDTASPARHSATIDLDDAAATANTSPSPNSALQQRSRTRADSGASRPLSMLHTYTPTTMDVNGDTPPELAPIFSFLNSHSNKLYQEGYFLKLHDLDSRGRPSTERVWTECFAQLVGTVLSLWDAAALDAAGEEGEVLPTFINLSDASIKMIESLPMNSSAGGNLQNVLSISTAANNRYLLHFNSLNSLTQWTAGIRLAMYEHATLQEAYTGSLIAGKGKMLNNIKSVMERSRFKSEDWARVRFGAGTPWRRCWCVITPPAEKALQKMAKEQKKKNPYAKAQAPKGDIKFYDTRRITKKTRPIATITDAYAAYAIYPQSKPLIDQSTLVKVEGLITIHSSPETTTEGFLFVMPEVHPAVTGFEMLLRWLFPVWDTFNLYGRPNRLIADTLDSRGLMFALPRDRRYGYLDILDVSGLIHTEGSQAWSERSWRSELKKLTSHRMNAGDTDLTPALRGHSKSASRTSLPSMTSKGGVKFDDSEVTQSSPTSRRGSPAPAHDDVPQIATPRRVGTAPVNGSLSGHRRSVSESMNYKRYQTETPSRLSIESGRGDHEQGPPPPAHGHPVQRRPPPPALLERIASEQGQPPVNSFEELSIEAGRAPVTPVAQPPEFMHGPSSKPASAPYQAPELRRATSKMDAATLHQMQEAAYQEDGRDGRSTYRPNGPSSEVAMDATRFAEAQADKSPRKDLVNRVLENNAQLSRSHSPESQVPQPGPPSPRIDAGPTESTVVRSSTPTSPMQRSPARKPLPASYTSPRLGRSSSPARSTSSSVSGFAHQYVDADALDDILHKDRSSTMKSGTNGHVLSNGMHDSTALSDQHGSLSPYTSAENTSNPSAPPVIDHEPSESHNRLNTFNAYANTTATDPTSPGPRSSSRAALTPDVFVDARSSAGTSPAGDQRSSYFGGRGSASPNARTPVDTADSNNRRSILWQPGGNPLRENIPTESLTAEQWVQHRASMASQPLAVRRPEPAGDRTSYSKRHSVAGITPPLSRTPSGDWSKRLSKTPPPMNASAPRAQGSYMQTTNASSRLDTTGANQLNAKDQMYVSRTTGAPLINMTRNDSNKQYDANAGLYAALQAREQDKAAAKRSYQSTTVQNAIAAKQQQDMNARMAAQFQMQQRNASQAAQAAQAAHLHAQKQQQQAGTPQQRHDPFQLRGIPPSRAQGFQQPSQYQQAPYQQSQYQQPHYSQSQFPPSQYAPSQFQQPSRPRPQYPQAQGASNYGTGPATRPSPR